MQNKSEHDTITYKAGYDTGPTNPMPQVCFNIYRGNKLKNMYLLVEGF